MSASHEQPNRWLHLRHPRGFDDAHFAIFRAHCEIWKAHCVATLKQWRHLPLMSGEAPGYLYFDPTLSSDRRIASLPIGGDYTAGSRATFENASSKLLWQYFLLDFQLELEEGLSEMRDSEVVTTWRRVLRPVAAGAS
ncbi:hypothetical protein [Haliangium ochraceum]|uniref:Uncharacterized protein n=1 Tax=Haliangium ochraceum (strain DSM 14365 / JCM 11303 / SMP-2) TaxID=502025 RepID=D0LWX1_HALO1|nr:hypothetical protein [Haliangium ochraceum]ACY14218.1 hypothetical protein Hoch_1668 [Haliangium ochraceum DSM 14365]